MKKKNINTVLKSLLDTSGENNVKLIELEGGTFRNNLFGITFNFPEDWFVVNREQLIELVENQLMVGEYEHLKEKLEFENQPSIIITKYDPSSDKYFGLISPTINFSIIPKHPDYSGYSLIEYADLIDSGMAFGYHPLKNFEVLKKGAIWTIDDYDAVNYETQYLFEHQDIDFGITVQMQVINIDYGDFFLDFSLTDCAEQNQKESEVFKSLIESIQLSD